MSGWIAADALDQRYGKGYRGEGAVSEGRVPVRDPIEEQLTTP